MPSPSRRWSAHRRYVFPNNTIYGVAGSGSSGFTGDGGAAMSATLSSPTGIAIDPDERFAYISDNGNRRIRVVDLSTRIINTLSGE